MAKRACPECGAELPAEAPEAPCPACLMQLGMRSWMARQPGPGESPLTLAKGASFAAPAPAELAARFPQLEILEVRGAGGMGVVYKARQKSLDRLVALKILHPQFAQDPNFAQRFTREARALARLNHPNIVAVYDFGEVEGLYYFLMEYVDGVDLRSLISQKSLTPEQAIALVPQLCDALQYAHEEGVVHRDIKPENLLVDKRGRVKIADFGLAKLLGMTAFDLALTGSRQVMGTFHYMAPEQLERPEQVDHRADIYALGVVLYEMLTGKLPLGRFDLPSQRAPVDARLDDVVLRAMEREPERRYQHASDVKSDVESLGKSEPMAPGSSRSPLRGEEAELDEARETLAMPALGLIAYGALALIAAVVGFATLCVLQFVEGEFDGWRGRQTLAMFLSMSLGGGLIACVVLMAGIKMRRLENYDFVVVGAIVTLLTSATPFTWPFGLCLGIWSLKLLHKREVQRAFKLQWQAWERDPAMSAWREAREIAAGPAWAMIALGAVSVLAPLVVLLFLDPMDRDDLPFWAWALVGGLTGAVMIAGGLAMRRLKNYELAMAGAVAAHFSLGPLWPLTLLAGQWTLRALRSPRVRRQFSAAHEAAITDDGFGAPGEDMRRDDVVGWAKSRVRGPATALQVTGALAMAISLIPLLSAATVIGSPRGSILLPIVVSLGHLLLAIPLGPAIILGAVSMKRLESRWLASLGAILAMLPLNLACVLGIPVGIWCLIVLSRDEVEHGFAAEGASLDGFQRRLNRASIWLRITAVVAAMPMVAPWVAFLLMPPPTEGQFWTIGAGLAALSCLTAVSAAVMVSGAAHMQRGSSHGWAIAGSIAAMLPLHLAFPLGIPCGLHALSLLSKPGAREWFETSPAKRAA